MKNNIKRIIAASLAATTVFSLAACTGGEAAETTPATTIDNPLDEEDKAALEEVGVDLLTGELENKTIKWLSNWDINPDSSGKKTPVELELFQTKFGGIVEYYASDWGTRYTDLSTHVLGDTGIDFFPAGDLDGFPMGAISGMFQGFDDYVDWDSQLWSEVKPIADMFMWGDDHYIIATATTDGPVVIFNQQTFEEYGLDNPVELFENGDWTWDTFKQLLMDYCDPDNGLNGIDGWYTEAALMKTTGVPVVDIKDGRLISNIGNSDVERVMNFMADLYNNNLVIDKSQYDWAEQPQFIGEGKDLFYPCGLWALYGAPDTWQVKFGDDVMFVPMPRDPEADAYYLPAGVDGYFLCKGAQNPEGVIKFAECKMVANKDETAIAIGEAELKSTYGWTDEMVEMKQTVLDMTLENPVFDFYNGTNADITSILDSGETGIRASLQSGKSWATTREEIGSAIAEWLEDINVAAGV